MRFIIHELPYERPLAAGQLHYEQDGRPTGAVESWRVSAALDGYRFLRVDLDARQAPSGRSTVYHVTLNPAGRPELLKLRFWGDGLDVSGTIVREGDEFLGTRKVSGQAVDDAVAADAFWFPAASGLALLRDFGDGMFAAATLATEPETPAGVLALLETEVMLEGRAVEPLEVSGTRHEATPLDVRWADQARTVWLHRDGWPLRVRRHSDGLLAAATRLVEYHYSSPTR